MQANNITPTLSAAKPVVKNNFFTRMIEKIKGRKVKKPCTPSFDLDLEAGEKEAAKKPSFWKRFKQCFNKTFSKKSAKPYQEPVTPIQARLPFQMPVDEVPSVVIKEHPTADEFVRVSPSPSLDEAARQILVPSGLFSVALFDEENDYEDDEDEDEDNIHFDPSFPIDKEDREFKAEKSYPVIETVRVAIPEAQCAVVECWEEVIPEACSAVIEIWPAAVEAVKDIKGTTDVACDTVATQEEPQVAVADIVVEEYYTTTEVVVNPAEISLDLFVLKDLDYLLPPVLSDSAPEPAAACAGPLVRKSALAAPLRRRSVNVAKVNCEGIKRTSRVSRVGRPTRRGKENACPAGLLSAISE